MVSINSNKQGIKLVNNSSSIRRDRYGMMVIRNSRNGTKKCNKMLRIVLTVQRKIRIIAISIAINRRLQLLVSPLSRIAMSSRNSRIKGRAVRRNSRKLGRLSKELKTIKTKMVMMIMIMDNNRSLLHLIVQ